MSAAFLDRKEAVDSLMRGEFLDRKEFVDSLMRSATTKDDWSGFVKFAFVVSCSMWKAEIKGLFEAKHLTVVTTCLNILNDGETTQEDLKAGRVSESKPSEAT